MKELINKNAKMYMILSMFILIGTLGVTYAYYSATITNNTSVEGTAGGGELPTLTVSRISTEANGNLIPVDMDTTTLTKAASRNPKCIDNNGYTGCQIYSVTVKNNSNIQQSYNIELSRVSGPNAPNVDAVTMGTSSNSVTNVTSIKNNGLICTTNNVSNGQTTAACYFMVLINNINSSQTDNGTFTGTVTITSTTGAKVKADFGLGEKLTTTIENLYNNASKSTVANNGITYNYATSVSLMNDRLGNSNTNINDGNIRYYGATPNNYIHIGDIYEEDVTENGIQRKKGEPILYRIIGLFKDVELSNGTKKDLIKVIRNEPIGKYSWDTSESTINSGYGINEWSQADLMKLLNPGYENETVGGSLYWNSGSGNCYSSQNNSTTNCDFTSKGLSISVQNNIEPVKWNLGGWNTASKFANEMYGYERGNNIIQNPSDGIPRTTLWSGRIALAYPSDYGYAVDLSTCSSKLSAYNDTECKSANWMYQGITSVGSLSSWFLTSMYDYEHSAWRVLSSGMVYRGENVGISYNASPVFYLDPELIIESGTGKSDDPYVIW
jgi:hypothetical protein